jgi:hypothetical protein
MRSSAGAERGWRVSEEVSMSGPVVYSSRERFWLSVLALFGLLGLNGVFLYALVFRPDAVSAAVTNPVAAAFMVEALLMVGVLSYLLTRWQVMRLHWGWFVLLSLIGGIAFALPVVLLRSTSDTASRAA